MFHSARWNHGARLDGKRVAVVGTGASAIQIVPEIQPTVGRLVLFQRTPAWVLPRRDRAITGPERWIYCHVPPAQRLARLGNYLAREPAVGAFVAKPGILKAAQRIAARHLAKSVADPVLRAKLTPYYVMGCKRILRMASSVWATGGCLSWYLNAAGHNTTLWPGSTLRFRRATRRLDLSEYRVIGA